MNLENLLDAIAFGELDGKLDELLLAIYRRKGSISLTPSLLGKRVRLNGLAVPGKLRGLPGEVIKEKATTVDVRLDDNPQAGRYAGGPIRCPKIIVSEE